MYIYIYVYIYIYICTHKNPHLAKFLLLPSESVTEGIVPHSSEHGGELSALFQIRSLLGFFVIGIHNSAGFIPGR